MYTLYLQRSGRYIAPSLRSLTSSTLLLEAASISIISLILELSASLQTSHSKQGLPFTLLGQHSALANILAQVVFPVPLEPVNRYA